jgi:hypothetical protein
MTAATQSAQPQRPGRTDGVAGEFTVFCEIKPGQGDALREVLDELSSALGRGTVPRCNRSAHCTTRGM